MPYWVQGNAQQIFHAFGQDWAIAEKKDDTKIVYRDFPAVNFLGTVQQAIRHFKIWYTQSQGKYYLQGNMTAGNSAFLFGPNPLKKEGEDPDVSHTNLVRQSFSYVNDAGENCGLLVMYRKDDPTQWVMVLGKNGHAVPQDRSIFCLSSFDLSPFIKVPNSGVAVSVVPSVEPLLQQLGSTLPRSLLQHAVNGDNAINLRVQRIALLMRKLQVNEESVTLRGPIPFAELNLPALFADNLALDRIVQYKIQDEFPLSGNTLKDLLADPPSPLRQELEALQFTDDERINKSLLKIIIVFYEKGLLQQNRQLLTNRELINKFSAYMWDETQIKLIPFLIEQEYSDEEIRLILSNAAYYQALNRLIDLEPALAIEAKECFKDPAKLAELMTIHNFPDEDCKRLCLIFWVKENELGKELSVDAYQHIRAEAEAYPLMASSLVALDQTKTIDIKKLEQHVLDPHLHLQDSIKHHFAKEFEGYAALGARLYQLNTQELLAANTALLLLRKTGGITPQEYQLVLGKDNKGHALRLLLPQLAHIEDETHRKTLIKVLYAGVIGVQTQGHQVQDIKDPQQLVLAQCLRERFICVTLMQNFALMSDVKHKAAMVELAAEESERANRFRQVILQVEAQCNVISERLSSSESYQKMHGEWKKAQESYRKKLYMLAYDGLMNPHTKVRTRLQAAEKDILKIVDPQLEPGIYKDVIDVLIAIANILIAACSLTVANRLKHHWTGNFWFFNQSASGEEIRAVDRSVLKLIAPEEAEEAEVEEEYENGIWSIMPFVK